MNLSYQGLIDARKGYAPRSLFQPVISDAVRRKSENTVVDFTLVPDQEKRIFASRYKLHLPSGPELRAELRRELRSLS